MGGLCDVLTRLDYFIFLKFHGLAGRWTNTIAGLCGLALVNRVGDLGHLSQSNLSQN